MRRRKKWDEDVQGTTAVNSGVVLGTLGRTSGGNTGATSDSAFISVARRTHDFTPHLQS